MYRAVRHVLWPYCEFEVVDVPVVAKVRGAGGDTRCVVLLPDRWELGDSVHIAIPPRRGFETEA